MRDVLQASDGPRIVVPLLLFPDAALQSVTVVAGREPDVVVSHTLGPDWSIAEVMVQRLIEAGATKEDTIVLATDVVPDTDAVLEIGQAAQLLSAVWGGPVHVGSLGGPETPLDDALDIARAHGRRIVVASYVLTEGAAWDAFTQSGADVVTLPILNNDRPDHRLVRLVLNRVVDVERPTVGA